MFACYFLADQIVDPVSINEILTEYCTLWKGTGLHLGLNESVLSTIESDYKEQRKCFEMTLKKWSKQDQDKAKWGVLELALTNANRAELSLEKLLECKL